MVEFCPLELWERQSPLVQMRQGTHISKDLHHFKGTDNERVKQMLKESDDFASRLKSFKKHINENSSAISGNHPIFSVFCSHPAQNLTSFN